MPIEIHDRCPVCDNVGRALQVPGSKQLLCETDGCRVKEYTQYVE